MCVLAEAVDPTEPINALIDISDVQLDDQLLEIEKLTTIDQAAAAAAAAAVAATNTKSESGQATSDNLVDLLDSSVDHEKLFSDLLSPLSLESNTTNNSNNDSDLLGLNQPSSFDADWTAAFGNNLSNQQIFSSSMTQDNFGASHNSFLPSSLLSELLSSTNKSTMASSASPSSTLTGMSKAKPTAAATGKTADKSNWINLFAELDPLQNPDAIGKMAGDEADRNC